MVHFLLPFVSFLSLSGSAYSVPHELSKRDVNATGDSRCTTYMCISALVNGSTVQYTLSGTGRRSVGWLGMGFGSQMAHSPMVIMWGNSDGSTTLSQRQASGQNTPSLVSSPPRVATLSTALSTTSGNSVFVFTIPANSDTKQTLIYGFSSTNPGSSDGSASIQQHLDYGTVQLDLTKALSANGTISSSTTEIPMTPRQRLIVAHAIVCVIGFALLLPFGVLLARYLRTLTPTWYTGHWIAQAGIAGPIIIVGVVLGLQASDKSGPSPSSDHKTFGFVLLALYVMQCVLGAFIHYVKPKSGGRPPQNYFHAILGLSVVGLGMYQIRTGYKEEWPDFSGLDPMPKGINTLWIVWCIVLPVLYAGGLFLLRKQYRQEKDSRKREAGPIYYAPVGS